MELGRQEQKLIILGNSPDQEEKRKEISSLASGGREPIARTRGIVPMWHFRPKEP
jgi:hypothetical protein